MNMYESNGIEQLELLSVKESNEKRVPAKRVDIVSLRLVKETSLLYKDRAIRSPEDGYNLFKQFLGKLDREYFVVMCLDVKNQPTAINICHIGSLNASIVHPREVMKAAILSNSASILVLHNRSSGASHSHNSDTILRAEYDTNENSPLIEQSVEGLFLFQLLFQPYIIILKIIIKPYFPLRR